MANDKVKSEQATGIDSVASDSLRQEIQIGFALGGGSVLVVRLPAGSIAALYLGLLRCAPDFELTDENLNLAQPVRLRSPVKPLGWKDDRKGLCLNLGRVDVPLVLELNQIDELIRELELLRDQDSDIDHRLN